MHQESLDRLKARFAGRKAPMPANNLKQAEMPEGCIVLNNENGTAPGAIIEHKDNIFIMLPGPPSEMRPMLLEKVRPYLEKKTDYVIHSKSLRIFGVGESAAEEKLKDIIERQTNPTIAPYAKIGEMELRLTARAHSVAEAEEMLLPLEKEVRDIIGDFIYAEGEDANLQKTVVELLVNKGMKVSTAESCTGGLVAKKITEVSGASEIFHAGFVTYSNEEKEKLLGVRHKTLEEFGAVSEQTALEMSNGAMERANADIGIGITGIAGPTGGTKDKPVGLVYISICTKDYHKAYRLQLNGNRDVVRERASLYALDMIRRYALGCLNADYIW